MVDWLAGSMQDALVTEELDPGLFHRSRSQPERQSMRVEHFTILLKSAIGVARLLRPTPPERRSASSTVTTSRW